MLTLYYSPGACSLAVHLSLLEAALPFELVRVSTKKGEHLSAEYRAVHPLARVPALRLDSGEILTEVPALLRYIAHEGRGELWPRDTLAAARADEWASLFCSMVHPAFVSFFRPERFTKNETALGILREECRETFRAALAYVEGRLDDSGHVIERRFTLLDSYAFVFYLWALRLDVPIAGFERYRRVVERVVVRPAMARAFEAEGLDLEFVRRALGATGAAEGVAAAV